MSELTMTVPVDPGEEQVPTARTANFGQTFRAIAWSFLGIRRSADHERQVDQYPAARS